MLVGCEMPLFPPLRAKEGVLPQGEGVSGADGGVSRAERGPSTGPRWQAPLTREPPPILQQGVTLLGGHGWALQGAITGILYRRSSERPASVSGRRTRPGLSAVCPGALLLRTSCFLCCPAVCPPVCLPPVSLPLRPLLFLQHPISIPPALPTRSDP